MGGISGKKKKKREGGGAATALQGQDTEQQGGERIKPKEVTVIWAAARLIAAGIVALIAYMYSQTDNPSAGNTVGTGKKPSSSSTLDNDISFFSTQSIVDAMRDDQNGTSEYRSRLWGSYRSGQYVGIRAALPQSPLFGVMWFHDAQHLRHDADARDGLDKYGWLRHDGKMYGRQQLIDGPLAVRTCSSLSFFSIA